MKRRICTNCGYTILKSGTSDPYVCRDCERFLSSWDSVGNRYGYLDI